MEALNKFKMFEEDFAENIIVSPYSEFSREEWIQIHRFYEKCREISPQGSFLKMIFSKSGPLLRGWLHVHSICFQADCRVEAGHLEEALKKMEEKLNDSLSEWRKKRDLEKVAMSGEVH